MGFFVKILLEVDLTLSLQRVLMVNDDDDDSPIMLSYEKMLEMCC